MKNFKIIISTLVLAGLLFGLNFLFASKFKAGECVRDNKDGFIWNVNDFSLGKYRVMGWFDGAWGDAVEAKKILLERKDANGIQVNSIIVCPEFGSKLK